GVGANGAGTRRQASLPLQALSGGARFAAARLRARYRTGVVPPPAPSLRNARSDRRQATPRSLRRARALRRVHASAPRGDRSNRWLRSVVLPLFRGLRLEPAA